MGSCVIFLSFRVVVAPGRQGPGFGSEKGESGAGRDCQTLSTRHPASALAALTRSLAALKGAP
jgi:hypothetical protein